MLTDLAQIKNYFPCVKTYYSQFFGNDVASVVNRAGLKVYLGIFMGQGLDETEISYAINAAKAFPNTVLGIVIGNENLDGSSTGYQPGNIADIYYRLKAAGVTQPIGTSQTYTAYVNHWVGNLPSTLDFLGVNLYPFFGWNYGNNWADLMTGMRAYKSTLNGMYGGLSYKFVITETGWPTGGSVRSGNPPTTALAQQYFNQFIQTTCSYYFNDWGTWMSYYIFYDEKAGVNWGIDNNEFFGLANPNGFLKFPLDVLACTRH